MTHGSRLAGLATGGNPLAVVAGAVAVGAAGAAVAAYYGPQASDAILGELGG